MRFLVTYTLATLGNPPPPFFVHEAFWWCDGEEIQENAKKALIDFDEITATSELIDLLRDSRRQRGGSTRSSDNKD